MNFNNIKFKGTFRSYQQRILDSADLYLSDGKINIVYGTHTHVKTADGQILPRGTGYISDIGMCGETGGILGMDPDVVVERMRTSLPHNFKLASGPCRADGVIFTLDTTSGRVTNIESISF